MMPVSAATAAAAMMPNCVVGKDSLGTTKSQVFLFASHTYSTDTHTHTHRADSVGNAVQMESVYFVGALSLDGARYDLNESDTRY